MQVRISVWPENSPPVFKGLRNWQVAPGETLEFTVQVEDRDEDSLQLRHQVLPLQAKFEGGVFSWTPNERHDGDHSAVFVVSDGKLTVVDSILIRVGGTNQSPTISSVSDISLSEGKRMLISLEARDIDGDALEYTIGPLEEGMQVEAEQSVGDIPDSVSGVIPRRLKVGLVWQSGFAQAGVYPMSFIVTDGFLQDSTQFEITVRDVNYPPPP